MVNKSILAEFVHARTGLSKRASKALLNDLLKYATKSLMTGSKVQLVGFGTFEVIDRGERKGRNPATGETLVIPAHQTVHFKPGKLLKDAVQHD